MGQTATQWPTCVLMFSGGRDSTLSAMRLAKSGFNLILVTITTDHLFGIDRVHARLKELSTLLPKSTSWLHAIAGEELHSGISSPSTCLPCHSIYTIIAAVIADTNDARAIAFGYSGYQSSWAEQTPMAVRYLKAVLAEHQYELILPVYDVKTKDAAIDELQSYGISSDALEQKCLRQQLNLVTDGVSLERQILTWKDLLEASLNRRAESRFELRTHLQLRDFEN